MPYIARHDERDKILIDKRALERNLELMGVRLDANETAGLINTWNYARTGNYDIEYTALKARTLIPIANDVPSWAETFSYKSWDRVGMAKFIANYADDLPNVDAFAKEYYAKTHEIGDSYQFSIIDLERGRATGQYQIDTIRARIAREAFELKLEEVAAIGSADHNLTGLVNNANVPVVSAITGTWGTASAQQILADMNKLAQAVVDNTKELHPPDTIIMPATKFGLISTTTLSADNPTTVKTAFLANNPWIKNIDTWYKLNTAGVGNAARMMAYKRDPAVVELLITREFTEEQPQARNLSFVVNCHGRIGGVRFYRPLAAAYMDAI
jgi:hypothetical protein